MNEKDREYEKLLDIIISDDELYLDWRVYQRDNRDRIPLYPGSAIRNAGITLMKEFLSIKEVLK